MTTYLIIGIITTAFMLICSVTGDASYFETAARDPAFWVLRLLDVVTWPFVVVYITTRLIQSHKEKEKES